MQEVTGSIPVFSTKKALYFVGSMVLFFLPKPVFGGCIALPAPFSGFCRRFLYNPQLLTLHHFQKGMFAARFFSRLLHPPLQCTAYNAPTTMQLSYYNVDEAFLQTPTAAWGKSMGLPCRASQVGILRLSGKRFEPSIRKKRKILIPTWVYSCCVRHEENRSENCRIVFLQMGVSRMGYGYCSIIYGQIRQKSLIFFVYL